MISMICSVGKKLELGKNKDLIWHLSKDLKYFKETTTGHTVVMGKTTYESLPGNLPGRKMVVLNFDKIDGIDTVYSIQEILDRYLNIPEEVFIIGGASLYKQFIDYANKLYLTEIDASDNEADTFFPKFDKNEWNKSIINEDEQNDIKFKMCIYEKK